MRTAIVYAVLGMAMAMGAAAQPLPIDVTIRAVRKTLDDGHPSEALATLEATDMSHASTRDRARVQFYTARAYEDLGDEQGAIAAYAHAVDLEPTYGAAMNNLGQLISRRGNYAAAAELLKKAAALDDSRRPLYLNNYAAASEKAGNIEAARNAYALLAAAQPDNIEAHLNSIRLLDDPLRMAALLVKLSNRGEVQPAQSLALDLLGKPFDARGKRALLSVVAGTLARQHIDPPRFTALPVASRIAALRDDALIRDGIDEILLLYHGDVDSARYRWWSLPARDERFGALIRDIGATCAGSGEKQKAEAYFKLALDYSKGADPEAFVELADLYYAQKRIADLDSLSRDFERPMFAAKTAMIASGDYAGEYRFHIALGTMYAYLEHWGDENTPASAIYQLRQAERAAADYNETRKWGPKIPTDPKTIELLATGYAKTKHVDHAIALRIDTADAFVAEGRKTAADGLLRTIKADPSVIKDPAYRQRYDDVTGKLGKAIETDFVIGFPDTIDVTITSVEPTASAMPSSLAKRLVSAVASFVQAETELDRDRAEATLQGLGVSDLDPTTMSRTTGEFVIEVDGKPVRYRYAVRFIAGQ